MCYRRWLESTCIFGTNDVICCAIWHYLSFLPYQFSIFDDVGGLTALFRRSCSSQLLINRVVSCTCDLSFVPTRVEMETWTKHDKDIDSPTLVPRRIRAIRVRGRRLGNSPDKLNSWGHIRNCRGRLGTRLRFSICTSCTSVPARTTTSQDIKWLTSLNLLSSNEG